MNNIRYNIVLLHCKARYLTIESGFQMLRNQWSTMTIIRNYETAFFEAAASSVIVTQKKLSIEIK